MTIVVSATYDPASPPTSHLPEDGVLRLEVDSSATRSLIDEALGRDTAAATPGRSRA